MGGVIIKYMREETKQYYKLRKKKIPLSKIAERIKKNFKKVITALK